MYNWIAFHPLHSTKSPATKLITAPITLLKEVWRERLQTDSSNRLISQDRKEQSRDRGSFWGVQKAQKVCLFVCLFLRFFPLHLKSPLSCFESKLPRQNSQSDVIIDNRIEKLSYLIQHQPTGESVCAKETWIDITVIFPRETDKKKLLSFHWHRRSKTPWLDSRSRKCQQKTVGFDAARADF